MQTLVAYAQPVNAQTSAVPPMAVSRYVASMQPEQKIIADWMGRQLKRKGWTGEEWARRAHISTSTVTRAQHENYPSVTSVLTLDKLASAAGLPSILSYLEADTPHTLPSEAVLSALFAGMLRGLADRCSPEETPQLLARGLRQALELLSRNPVIAQNPPALSATAEALTMLPHRPGADT